MDATMHLIARSVQLAVMTAPTSSVGDAVAIARNRRESFAAMLRRTLVGSSRSTRFA
jgi:hypothetical protein